MHRRIVLTCLLLVSSIATSVATWSHEWFRGTNSSYREYFSGEHRTGSRLRVGLLGASNCNGAACETVELARDGESRKIAATFRRSGAVAAAVGILQAFLSATVAFCTLLGLSWTRRISGATFAVATLGTIPLIVFALSQPGWFRSHSVLPGSSWPLIGAASIICVFVGAMGMFRRNTGSVRV